LQLKKVKGLISQKISKIHARIKAYEIQAVSLFHGMAEQKIGNELPYQGKYYAQLVDNASQADRFPTEQ